MAERDRPAGPSARREPTSAAEEIAARAAGRARFATPQPNLTGQGIIASYSRRFWALTVALGAVTGLAAGGLMELLRLVERLAYGQRRASFLATVEAAAGWRPFAALAVAAVVVIVGVRLLGRLPLSGGTEVSDSLWHGGGRMAFVPSLGRAVLSIVTVALGVSLGREAAPQLAGAATASRLCDWAGFPLWQRRLLVAAGAGAGFAAVYNVPLGGTLFALEVLLGTLALPLVLPALVVSCTATAVAWTMLGTGPTYTVPNYAVHGSQVVWAVLVGPIIGFAAVGWARLITLASRLRPHGGPRQWVAPWLAFAALAALAVPYPQLLGNGRDIVQLAVVGHVSIGLLLVLFALKPFVTAGCLSSGSPGGLFTPTFSIGVLFTGAAGLAWSHLWPGAAAGSYALIGGGAFLAAAMQGPLSGIVLVLELSRHLDALMVPTLIAVAEATIVARRLGARSIYSARLRLQPAGEEPPASSGTATLLALDDALPEELEPLGPR